LDSWIDVATQKKTHIQARYPNLTTNVFWHNGGGGLQQEQQHQ
jgi:hypothetical protein